MKKQNEDQPKLRLIPGGQQADEMMDLVRTMRDSMQTQIELHTIVAKIQKAKFDALIEQGFSESQALELAKSISV